MTEDDDAPDGPTMGWTGAQPAPPERIEPPDAAPPTAPMDPVVDPPPPPPPVPPATEPPTAAPATLPVAAVPTPIPGPAAWPPGGAPGGAAPEPAAGGGDRTALWITIAIMAGIVVVGAAVTLLLVRNRTGTTQVAETSTTVPASSSTTQLPPPTVPVTQTGATTTTPTVATTAPPVSPESLPADLLCRDLLARGLGYGDAVAYWGYSGYPDRMDSDGNGVPCETVYPATAIRGWWETTVTADRGGNPPGLLCRELAANGVGLRAAIAYWLAEGSPGRMDEDGNGVPCETVYSRGDFLDFFGGAGD